MSDGKPARRPRPPDPFLGGALIAVGALVTTLFGTCTVLTLSAREGRQESGLGLVSAAIAVVGLVIIREGWRTLRGDRGKGDPPGPGASS